VASEFYSRLVEFVFGNSRAFLRLEFNPVTAICDG